MNLAESLGNSKCSPNEIQTISKPRLQPQSSHDRSPALAPVIPQLGYTSVLTIWPTEREQMLDFQTCNPRTPHFVPAKTGMDGNLLGQFNKLAARCAFPSCYQNGLLHTAFGLFSVISGAACSLSKFFTAGVGISFNPVIIIAGIIAAAILSFLFAYVMQIKIFVPRNLCFYSNDGSPPLVRVIVPFVAYVAVAIFCIVDGSNYSIIAALGCGYALLALFTYYKCGRSGLFTLSLLVFVIPTAAGRFGFLPFPDLLGNAGLAMLVNGVIFTTCGTTFLNIAINGFNHTMMREKLHEYLTSGDKRKKFLAVTYLCTQLDSRVLGDVLDIVYDEEPVIAYIAQVAISDAWGPEVEKNYVPGEINWTSEVVREARVRHSEQVQEELVKRWMKHFTLVEGNMRELANESEQRLKNLIRMGLGDVVYKPAQYIALELMGCTQTPQAYSALMRCLLASDHKVVKSAIVGFYGAGVDAIPYLEKFYVANRAWIRRRAIYATRSLLSYLRRFRNIDVSLAYEMLSDGLDTLMHADDTGTFAAAIQLLPLETEDEIQIVEAYCANDRPLICIEAMCALLEPHPDRAKRWIYDALFDSLPSVRYAAVKLCVALGTKEASIEICKIVKDEKDPLVREVLVHALETFEGKFFPTPAAEKGRRRR